MLRSVRSVKSPFLFFIPRLNLVLADLIAEQGMELRFIGGTFGGNIQPTPFLCLILKMLQIQPDKDIIVEFIRQEDFKYGAEQR